MLAYICDDATEMDSVSIQHVIERRYCQTDLACFPACQKVVAECFMLQATSHHQFWLKLGCHWCLSDWLDFLSFWTSWVAHCSCEGLQQVRNRNYLSNACKDAVECPLGNGMPVLINFSWLCTRGEQNCPTAIHISYVELGLSCGNKGDLHIWESKRWNW